MHYFKYTGFRLFSLFSIMIIGFFCVTKNIGILSYIESVQSHSWIDRPHVISPTVNGLTNSASVNNLRLANAATSTTVFSNCSKTDKTQIFYECPVTCTTTGAYCGGGRIAGMFNGNIILLALSDEGSFTWGYKNPSGAINRAITSCEQKKAFTFKGWVLPTNDELATLKQGGTCDICNNYLNYWSATESDASQAWMTSMDPGMGNGVASKNNSYFVRCIRRIPIVP